MARKRRNMARSVAKQKVLGIILAGARFGVDFATISDELQRSVTWVRGIVADLESEGHVVFQKRLSSCPAGYAWMVYGVGLLPVPDASMQYLESLLAVAS